jgi:hypothetical protein
MALGNVDVSALSEICVMAYEMPRVRVPMRSGSTVSVGSAMGYISATHKFAENCSELSIVAHCIEEKTVAVDSEILVHFDGRVKQIYEQVSSELIVALDTAI